MNVCKYLCLDISACGQQSPKVSLFSVFGLMIYKLNAHSGEVVFAVLFIRLPFVAVLYSFGGRIAHGHVLKFIN